jgi:hypothetical protein
MQAKEFITEIDRIGSGEFTGGKESLEGHFPKGVKWLPLPGGSGLQWGVAKGTYSTNVYIIDPVPSPQSTKPFVKPYREAWWDDYTYKYRVKEAQRKWEEEKKGGKIELIGLLTLSKYRGPFKNAYDVHTITVDEDRRGIGLAKALYGLVLTQMKATLISGDSQTPGGRRNWASIASIPGTEVKGLLHLGDEEFGPKKALSANAKNWEKSDHETYHANADKKIDMLMQLGFQFLGSKTNGYGNLHHYFSFDVVSSNYLGSKELAPAVKNKLSELYGNYSTLLYAQWTGQV